jgi:hypothetical protein
MVSLCYFLAHRPRGTSPACYVIRLLFSKRKLGVHFTSSGRPLNTRGGPEHRAAVPTLTSHVSTRAFRN